MSKKSIIIISVILVLIIISIGIYFIILKKDGDKHIINNNEIKEDTEEDSEITNIKIIINNVTYMATLEQNDTVKELLKILPLEINMNDLNNNEKYYYLDTTFKTSSYNPQIIEKGDIMLHGDNCLVIFYKTFKTTYHYTKIGHINNMPNLNNDSITVKIEK